MRKNSCKWVVEFSVDDTWVEDGFDLDDERALQMLMGDLSYAAESELRAKVIKRPSAERVKKLQNGSSKEVTNA